MIRKWTAKLRRTLEKHSVAARKKLQVPIKLSIEPDKNTGSLRLPAKYNFIIGETRDLSMSGIGFVVDSIRLQDNYLVGDGRVLNAELMLPEGKVKLQLMGQRYELADEHSSTNQYFIGARILKMSEGDREKYKECLKKRKPKTGALELGIDEG